MNKKLLIPTLTVAVLGAGTMGINIAKADEGSSTHQTIIERLSERFGLNENDIEAVFEKAREKQHQEMIVKHENRLDNLVKEGKITEGQKNLIIEKHKQLRVGRMINFEEFKNLTREEKRKKAEEQRTEMKKWAEENGIDLQFFFDGYGLKGHHYRSL